MNQIFLGEPSEYIKNQFIQTFPSWPAYTTLEFVDGTTQTKEISGTATLENIGVKTGAYYGNKTLTYCKLGINVTEISDYAFSYCRSLTSIDIPNSISSIGNETFHACISLTSIDIPNSVSSIGDGAFQYCYSLTSINIPNSVSSIGDRAFYYCSSLTSIVFEGRAMSDITAMTNYPWYVDTSAIIPGIS